MEEKSRAGKGETRWQDPGSRKASSEYRRPCVPLTGWQWSQVSGEFSRGGKRFCESYRKCAGGVGGCSGLTIGSPHGLGHLGVQALVRNEVCTLLETLVTLATAEWPLACVHTPVV